MAALKPSQIRTFVMNALEAGEIPYVSGPPGIGKSDIMESVAKDLNLKLLDIRLSQMLPEDLTGLPSMDDVRKKATYVEFDTFPMENDKVPDGFVGWLIFLDELSSASEEVMAAIYSLLLGGKVGGKPIHEMALICAAGNRAKDSAIARALPDTLITRMLCVEMKVNVADWLKWAKTANNANDTVSSFIEKNPDQLLGNVNHEKREELEAYPQPRGWGKAMGIVNLHESRALKIAGRTKKDPSSGLPIPTTKNTGSAIKNDIKALINAAVGNSASRAFCEHYNESIVIAPPWEVAQSPNSTTIPTTQIGKAKLTADLAEFYLKSGDQSRDSLIQFMNRMDSEHSSLFVEIISEDLGTTASDMKMIQELKDRLGVTVMTPMPKKGQTGVSGHVAAPVPVRPPSGASNAAKNQYKDAMLAWEVEHGEKDTLSNYNGNIGNDLFD